MFESFNISEGAIRVDFVPLYILIACRAGSLNFSPTLLQILFCYLAFKVIEAVIHMSSSFTSKYNATNVKNIGWFGFKFFDFQTKTPVSKSLYACLASNSLIWVHKREEGLSTQFNVQLSQFFVVSHGHADAVARHSNYFFVIWETLRRKSTAFWSCCNAKLFFCSFSIRSNWKQSPRLIDQTCEKDNSHEKP